MTTRRAVLTGLIMAAASTAGLSTGAFAQQKTEITLARFFGACDADYGTNLDLTKARGECGMITTLVNVFNATNKDNIVVKPQIIEWGPYYQQLTARLAAKDVPNVAVMHTSQIGDFARIVEPLDDAFKSVGIDVNDFTPQRQERRHCQRQDQRACRGIPIHGSGTSTSTCSRRRGSSTARATRSFPRRSTR